MKKDAFYFPHDSNAKDDPKCMVLIDQLGLEGYGIFWVLIETLRDQPNYKYQLALIPILARRFNTTAEKMKAVVMNYQLFQFDENEFFYSNSLNERMIKVEALREQRRLAGIASGEKRSKKLELSENNNERSTNVQRTDEQMLNENEQRKEKETKVNQTKENETKENNEKTEVFSGEVSKSKKPKKHNLDLECFSDSEKPIIEKWIEYRKQLKKPITQAALFLLRDDIKKTGIGYIEKQINQSIKNGWIGLFEVKDHNAKADLYKPSGEDIRNNPNRLSFK